MQTRAAELLGRNAHSAQPSECAGTPHKMSLVRLPFSRHKILRYAQD